METFCCAGSHWQERWVEAFKGPARQFCYMTVAKNIKSIFITLPQRGWFKLGFGGDLKPYYQVYKRKEETRRI